MFDAGEMDSETCGKKQISCVKFVRDFRSTLFVPLLKSPKTKANHFVIEPFLFGFQLFIISECFDIVEQNTAT